MASIEDQIDLEKLYHKNQVNQRLRKEFSIPEFAEHVQRAGIPLDFAIDLCSTMVLMKRTEVSVLVGKLHRHFLRDEGEISTAMQKTSDMLIKAAEADLVDYDPISGKMILRYELDVTPDVHEDLERYQFPLPMIVEPSPVENNRQSGYLTQRGSVILKAGNHHDEDVCLDHLNRVNKTAYVMNPTIARVVKNQWKNLDRQKEFETLEDYRSRVKAFEKFNAHARDAMEAIYMVADKFYFTHKYDKRGRVYSQGHHLNLQGNDWQKACIEFADAEIVEGA